MLLSYGYAEADLDESLTARLGAITILHEFFSLKRVLDFYADRPPTTFEELEARVFGLGT
jgi:hypothetical protein